MKYLLIAFLSLVATTGSGQDFGYTPCGTWVLDKDTLSDWVTIDTLGDKSLSLVEQYGSYVQHNSDSSITFIPLYLYTAHWVYDAKRRDVPYANNLIYMPCGNDPCFTITQDRIDSMTGIHQRQTEWQRFRYIPYQPTEYEKLRDSLSAVSVIISQSNGAHDTLLFRYWDKSIVVNVADTIFIPNIDTLSVVGDCFGPDKETHLDYINIERIYIGDAIYRVHHRKKHVWLTRETPKQ